MSAHIRLQAYFEDEHIKKIHDRVKSAFELRREFFTSVLAELEDYER